jgi:glycosyl hydrolase family 26
MQLAKVALGVLVLGVAIHAATPFAATSQLDGQSSSILDGTGNGPTLPNRREDLPTTAHDPVARAPSAMLGAHVGYEYNPDAQAEFDALERAIGHNLALDNTHEGWPVMPDAARINWDFQHHRLPMVTWMIALKFGDPHSGCATADDILAGAYDGQIAKQVQAVKALGHPILIRFNHEMTNLKQHTCFTGFPVKQNPQLAGTKYVKVWKYVVDIFRSAGVTNVKWVWSPSNHAFENGLWRMFYPGGDYVDWIGADDYNTSDVPRSFATDPGINAFYNATSGMGKPLMIAETGAVSDPSQEPDPQTLWLTTAREYVKSHPAIKAFLYWDDQPPRALTGNRLQGAGLAAFKAMADDPYFQ